MPNREEAALRKVARTWPLLDAWRRAVRDPFIPDEGSDLALDALDWPPLPLSELALHGFASAVMHLHAIRLHLDRPHGAVELIPYAQMSAARSALIGASQMVWLLAPDVQTERLNRARMAAAYFYAEHGKYLDQVGDLDVSAEDFHARARIMVRNFVETRASELRKKRDRDGQRAAFNTTTMIEGAAKVAFEDDRSRAEVMVMWRNSSGAAHGLMWSQLGGHGAPQPTEELLATEAESAEEAILHEFRVGGDMIALANLYLAVHRLVLAGLRLRHSRSSAI